MYAIEANKSFVVGRLDNEVIIIVVEIGIANANVVLRDATDRVRKS